MLHIDVEVILNTYSNQNYHNSVINLVEKYLQTVKIRPNSIITNFNEHAFHNDVKVIIVGEIDDDNSFYIKFKNANIKWYVYTVNSMGPVPHIEIQGDESEEFHIATHLTLPAADLYNVWENLYYNDNIKQNLLKYAQTMMEFADKGVDINIISCNKLILLHGPPGTGKTSLCKALAQKLTIRMQHRYRSGCIVEINSHSLFSKWFSESGKLVGKMFSNIKDMVEKPDVLVCVLMDEIESLVHARDQTTGNEPLDSVRVVNAVLTQLDQIRRYPNVLILATSNMTDNIDLAFVDRADIKQYLGLPNEQAIYKIYHSCLMELVKTNIIIDTNQHLTSTINSAINDGINDSMSDSFQRVLLDLCGKSVGLSGRSLRKIPFIAHALYLDQASSSLEMDEFLNAMEHAIEKEKLERTHFTKFKSEVK